MNIPTSQVAGAPAFNLTGRTALITGGSRGIGRAIAKRFLEAGGSVILTARRANVLEETKAELEPIGRGKIMVAACDVAKAEDIKALWSAIGKRQIDILVNNAGTSTRGNFEEQSDELWQYDLDQKLFAAIRLTRLVLPGMKERRWGRILNVASIHGKQPAGGGAPTVVTRAANLALTKVLSGEYAPYNILVNALCTGLILTDQIDKRYAKFGAGMSFDEYLKTEAKNVPLNRIGTAEEYANVALFLASDFSSYITGAAINIDGGQCKVL